MKSIAELNTELTAKKRKLSRLEARRKKIAADLADVDKQIAALAGGAPARKRPAKKGKATRRRKAARKPKKRARRATGKPLLEYLKSALAKAPKGMRVREAAAAVRKAGYPTRSKNFYNIVAATLRESSDFTRVSRGVYKLKG